MEWDADAEEAVGRAPLLLRPFVRRKVEEFAREVGAKRVTAELLRKARARAGGGSAATPEPEIIERLESRLQSEQAEKRRTRTYHVRVCAGAVGCPRSLIPVAAIADALVQAIEASGFPDHLVAGREGRPILSHHRFQAAVAGCPNACCQPHICDFGVIGLAQPVLAPERCTACGGCVRACREEAVVLREDLPVIDLDRCIGCGDCVSACPSGSLQSGSSAYRIMVGGKLGRHPRLATDLATSTDQGQVPELLAATISLLIRKGSPGERLGSLIARDPAAESELRERGLPLTDQRQKEEKAR